jgi:hypothetical protein
MSLRKAFSTGGLVLQAVETLNKTHASTAVTGLFSQRVGIAFKGKCFDLGENFDEGINSFAGL